MVSYTEKPVRPSDFQGGAPGTLRRMWGLENVEEDPFRDDGRWLRGWMEDLRREEEDKRGEEKGEEKEIIEEEEGV